MNTYDADLFVDRLRAIRDAAISGDDLAADERGRGEYETIPAMARDDDRPIGNEDDLSEFH